MDKIGVSEYCHGFRCPKMLWLELNRGKGDVKRSGSDRNEEVYRCALRYFKNPAEISESMSIEEQLKKTEELLAVGESMVANGLFCWNGLWCRTDFIKKQSDGLRLVEVRDHAHINSVNYEVLAFKWYILKKCGIDIKNFSVLRINRNYERKKKLNVNMLFIMDDCTKEVLARQKTVSGKLSNIATVMKLDKEPKRRLGVYCDRPAQCRYREYCHRGLPSPSVLDLHHMSVTEKYRLLNKGVVTYGDVLGGNVRLSTECLRQLKFTYNDLPPYVDRKRLGDYLRKIRYPLYFLDFECFQQPVPRYRGIKPFMAIPFQFSLHVLRSRESETEHYEFLAKEGTDPRRPVAEALCRYIPKGSCVIAYNKHMEGDVLGYLARIFPDFSEQLLSLTAGMMDLMEPFSKGYYYCREMEGSFSIKNVLPALCGERDGLSYKSLSGVSDGEEAKAAYESLLEKSPQERENVKRELLDYCRLDTLAMVNILKKLYEAADL